MLDRSFGCIFGTMGAVRRVPCWLDLCLTAGRRYRMRNPHPHCDYQSGAAGGISCRQWKQSPHPAHRHAVHPMSPYGRPRPGPVQGPPGFGRLSLEHSRRHLPGGRSGPDTGLSPALFAGWILHALLSFGATGRLLCVRLS